MKKLFTLFAVAAMAFASQANVLTVCDAGEDGYQSGAVPIYGLWADTEGTTGQMIYPAEMLESMVGSEINEIKFYTTAYWYENWGDVTTAGSSAWINFEGAEIQLSLMEVDETGLPTAMVGATPVATTIPTYGDDNMTFVLDEPFVYEGGNLLIECKVIVPGDYGTTYFFGSATEEGSNSCYYGYDYYGSWYESSFNFLPMVTFTYEEGGVVPPPVEEDDYKLVVVDQNGVEHVFDLNKGDDGNYTTTLTLEYDPYFQFEWDYDLTDDENKAAHPVPFYFLVNGKRYSADGVVPTVMGYAMENPLVNGEDGFYTVPVGNAYTLGLAIYGEEYYVYAAVANPTGINELVNGKAVAGVRYFNMAGQEMKEANGMTIVVTTYTDGTSSAVKVIK